MFHPITKSTVRFTITENFDYLTPGMIYRGTPYRNGKGARIDQDDESGGTSLTRWQWYLLINGASGFREITE